jgi:hypothetical protein
MYTPLKWGGGPNRVRLSAYIGALKELPVDYKILITSLAGFPDPLDSATPFEQLPDNFVKHSLAYVSSVRPHLASPFCNMSDQDLMATSFMLVAKKRA